MKASEVLDRGVELAIADWKDPAMRTGLIVGMATSAACSRMGMRFIPSLLFSAAAMFGARQLYVVIGDMHQAALVDIGRHREMIELLKRPADACACED